ncbi:MAG: DNA polymerase III subunit delta, partial [Pontixanthobacter sp.]
MKATQKDFAAIATRAAAKCTTFFFCGPDEAGASAAAGRIVSLLKNPGDRVELAGAALRREPALLADEARSASLFGDARHIWVRAAGDEAHGAVENHLGATGEACPVLIVATSATDKSRTAKLLTKRDDALTAMFYPPDLGDITTSVRRMADAAGLRLDGDLAQRIAQGAGLDIRLAASEV